MTFTSTGIWHVGDSNLEHCKIRLINLEGLIFFYFPALNQQGMNEKQIENVNLIFFKWVWKLNI